MTFITGYEDKKGPYITKYERKFGSPSQIGAKGEDILIWNIYCHNHDNTSEVVLYIWDNTGSGGAGSYVSGVKEPVVSYGRDFLIFKQQLSQERIAITDQNDVPGPFPFANWQLETPIVGRNGIYVKGGLKDRGAHPLGNGISGDGASGSRWLSNADHLDWYILYSILPSSTPYIMSVKDGGGYSVDNEKGDQIITNGGSNYTGSPTVTFSGGGATIQATATATITLGQVTRVHVSDGNGGEGYTSTPTITFSGGAGTGAAATPLMTTSIPEHEKRDNIAKGIIGTTIQQHASTSAYQDRLSYHDCELWGYSTWNNTSTQLSIMISNGDDVELLSVPVDARYEASSGDSGSTGNVQPRTGSVGPTMFPIPIYCKNGVKVKTTSSSGSGSGQIGVATSLLIRELETNMELTSSNTR
jgi:hypothetical protein